MNIIKRLIQFIAIIMFMVMCVMFGIGSSVMLVEAQNLMEISK